MILEEINPTLSKMKVKDQENIINKYTKFKENIKNEKYEEYKMYSILYKQRKNIKSLILN